METLKCQSCSIRKIKPILDNIDKSTNTKINKYEEIESFCKNNKGKILKFFYFYRNNIQEILYKSDNIIDIEDLEINSKLSELFYLSLLLWNSNLVNFSYSFDFISKLDSINQYNENYLTKIILSKIIIILIDYTKVLDIYYQNQNELEKIRIRNIGIIANNLELFNKEFKLKYDIKSFLNKKIDYIYMEIIVSLIKKNDFENYEYYEDVFKQLDLESIDITQTIFDGLSKEIDIKKNKFLENFKINKDRYLDEKVINFYHILFYIILKKPLYLYKNNFLINNRNNFLELLKNNSEKVQNLKIKEFILKSLSVSEYDSPKILNEYNSFDSMIFRDIENILPHSDKYISFILNKTTNEYSEAKKARKIDINIARKILTNLKVIIDIDFKTLKNRTMITKTLFIFGNNYKEIINYEKDLYDLDYNNDKKDQEEEIIYEKYKQFLDFWDNIKEYILKSKIRFNPRIILELKRIELKSGEFDMKCISSFKNQTLEKKIEFIDYNILSNGIRGKNLGFVMMINELSRDDYEGEEYTYDEVF